MNETSVFHHLVLRALLLPAKVMDFGPRKEFSHWFRCIQDALFQPSPC